MRALAFALAFALALVPQGALALSCAQPDLAWYFQSYQARDEHFVVLMGSIVVERESETIVPATDDGGERYLYPAVFSGAYLAEDGFRFGYSAELTVSICKGQWCRGLPDASETIYFVENTDDGLHLTRPLCEFDYPATAANRRLIERCMAGEYCEPEH